MINTTILSLSAVFLTKSPFSIVHLTSINSFYVDKSLFSKSFQSVFYFNINQGNVLFSNTLFKNILDCAILSDFKDKIINQRFSPNVNSARYYTFESCLFQNCISNKYNGSAICITVPKNSNFDVDISFEFSSFYKCRTQNGFGGAIYLYHFGDVSILETCFLECYASESSSDNNVEGSTVYINHRTSTERTRLRACSINSCPSDPLLCHKCDSIIKIFFGKISSVHSNFTNNCIEFGSSGISLSEQIIINIDLSQFMNCTGENTIFIIGENDNAFIIDTCNFINCVNNSSSSDKNNGIFVVFCKLLNIKESVFIMNSNKFLISENNSKSILYDLNHCFFTGCTFSLINPSHNKYTYFDSKECWEIITYKMPSNFFDDYLWIIIAVGSFILGLLITLIVFLISKCHSKHKNKMKANEFKSSELLSESLLKESN